jgi:hypothetical protein
MKPARSAATSLADGRLDAALAVHFHAARVDAARGMNGRAGVSLDEQRADARLGQRIEASNPTAAADDQDRNVLHGSSGSTGSLAPRCPFPARPPVAAIDVVAEDNGAVAGGAHRAVGDVGVTGSGRCNAPAGRRRSPGARVPAEAAALKTFSAKSAGSAGGCSHG